MNPGPSKAAEVLVAVLTPPACREEVLGDLYETYRSPVQYALDVLRTVPLVVLSRIRRTADPQTVLLQASVLYLSFVGAAWFTGSALPHDEWGLLRLAIPPAAAMIGVLLEDAYAKPGHRSPLKLIRGPAVGIWLAFVSQSIPLWTAIHGCAVGFLLSSAVRLSFPPRTQFQPVTGPAHRFTEAGNGIAPVLKNVAAIAGTILIGARTADYFSLPKPAVIAWLVFVLVVYHIWKRG